VIRRGKLRAYAEKGANMLIRAAQASDAGHLVRFINMAADDLPLHFWRASVGPGGDPWAWGMERAARDSGNFSYRNAWLAELNGAVAACLLGYPAEDTPAPVDPDTPAVLVPLLELEALAPGSWYLNVLATYEDFRGKGCGSALLAHAESVAQRAGHRTISLIAEDTHHDARHLYAAKGYSEVARRPVVKADWQVDAAEWILLTKSVDPADTGSQTGS
jgi:GNAT superfamily N-acetyltransferase